MGHDLPARVVAASPTNAASQRPRASAKRSVFGRTRSDSGGANTPGRDPISGSACRCWTRAREGPCGVAGRRGRSDRAGCGSNQLDLAVEWLPKYAPVLNDIENVWGQMKKSELAHQAFSKAGNLDQAIHTAVDAMNRRPSRPSVGQPANPGLVSPSVRWKCLHHQTPGPNT